MGPLLGLLAPLVSGAASGGLLGIGTQFLRNFGMQMLSQLAMNAVDRFIGPGPLATAIKGQIEQHLGPGLEGDPGTTQEIADRVAERTGMSPSEALEMVESLDDVMEDFLMNFLEDERRDKEGRGAAEGGVGGAEGGPATSGGWIAAMSKALGEIMDNQWAIAEAHINHVSDLGQQASTPEKWQVISKTSGFLSSSKTYGYKADDDTTAAKNQLPSATAKMQGEMQQFSMVMSAATTAIKTAGEANSAMARKQ